MVPGTCIESTCLSNYSTRAVNMQDKGCYPTQPRASEPHGKSHDEMLWSQQPSVPELSPQDVVSQEGRISDIHAYTWKHKRSLDQGVRISSSLSSPCETQMHTSCSKRTSEAQTDNPYRIIVSFQDETRQRVSILLGT
jgi:hypothetical protein